MIENRRPVLGSPVWALAIDLRSIVILPEDLQEIVVGDLGGIEFHFDGFGVAGAVGANFFIGGILGFAADVADARGDHSGYLAESRFHSPETSCCECGLLHVSLPGYLPIVL